MRRRALIYAALALTVPLPALALPGRGGPAQLPEQSLSVAVSLDSCGTAADSIVCKIDAGWNQIPGAERYTASVTRADGSVVDFGEVGAGSASFWVPYAGNGTYSVTVSAYGTPPGAEKPKVLARDRSTTASEADGEAAPEAVQSEPQVVPAEPLDPGTDPPSEPEEPICEEPEPEPEPVEPPPAELPEGEGEPAGEPISEQASEELDETAELRESVECPAEDAAPAPDAG